MNELVTLWNTYPVLVGFSTWIMTMSLGNLIALGVILFLFFATSLSVSYNERKSSMPKHPISILTIVLMYFYSSTLWIAIIPFAIVLFLTAFWNKPLFIYLNIFLPKHAKVL